VSDYPNTDSVVGDLVEFKEIRTSVGTSRLTTCLLERLELLNTSMRSLGIKPSNETEHVRLIVGPSGRKYPNRLLG